MEKGKFVPIQAINYVSLFFNMLFAIIFAAGAYFQFASTIPANKPIHASDIVIISILSFMALALLIMLAKKVKKIKHIAQLKQQNKYREGMFVIGNGIILHLGKGYSYIPKVDISGFELSKNKKPTTLSIQIKTNNGQKIKQSLNFLKADNQKLLKALNNWLQTGIWFWQ